MEPGGRPCRMQGVYGWGALPNAALNCSADDLLSLPELPSFLKCSAVECSNLTTEAPPTTPPDRSTVTGSTTGTLLTTTGTLLTTTGTLLTTTSSTVYPRDFNLAGVVVPCVLTAALVSVIIGVLVYRWCRRRKECMVVCSCMVVLTKDAENDGATTPSCGASSMSQPEHENEYKFPAREEEKLAAIAGPELGTGSKENGVGSGSGDASDMGYDGDPVTKNTSL